MKRAVYRAALRLLPLSKATLRRTGTGLDARREASLLDILRRHRAKGAELCLFDQQGGLWSYLYGDAGRGRMLQPGTAFRLASVSKLVSAACVIRLAQDGRLSLDGDVNDYLPYSLRHPGAPRKPISLRMLISHTAGLRDGKAYQAGLRLSSPVTSILAGDSYLASLPGESWSYSNLGAGLAACVLESVLSQSFEGIMQEHLFKPLGMEASFYPQRIRGELADAWRILPPRYKANFDAGERKLRPPGDADEPRPLHHYQLAQGNCCMSAENLRLLLLALMRPGYLSRASLDTMHKAEASFGERSAHLRQGLGVFLLDDPAISAVTLYGHQGNAYGAVHVAFYDPAGGRGLIFLSSGISEARRGFLCDAAQDVLKLCYEGEGAWQRIS